MSYGATIVLICALIVAAFSGSMRAEEQFEYRVISGIYATEAVPADEKVVEISIEEYCPHLIEFSMNTSQAQRDSVRGSYGGCSYVGAGSIRVWVYGYLPQSSLQYQSVVAIALGFARDNGVHGVLFEGIQDKGDESIWFDFMGVYRKGEVPEGFSGLH